VGQCGEMAFDHENIGHKRLGSSDLIIQNGKSDAAAKKTFIKIKPIS
jgi:hypothetical protein